jgi:hypothetical protein
MSCLAALSVDHVERGVRKLLKDEGDAIDATPAVIASTNFARDIGRPSEVV